MEKGGVGKYRMQHKSKLIVVVNLYIFNMEGWGGGGVGKYKMQSKTKLIITLGLTRFQHAM
jgi:hypothetical protein